MRSLVIYFSLTGNTEQVAKAIQAGIIQTVGQCDIAKIKDVNPRRLYEYDLIGLGCPVIAYEEPSNVKAFINDMRFVGGRHIFAFGTSGTRPERLFPSMVQKLNKKGLTVIGWHSWYCCVNFLILPKPYATDGHPDEIDLKEAEDFGREMAERSRRISAGETDLIPPVPPLPPPLIRYFADIDKMFKSMLNFHEEKCTYPECRLCMDNCPMDGIDLSVRPPVLATPCIKCAFCAFICPTGALECDEWLKINAPKLVGVARDYYVNYLEKAEAEGRFRRIIPEEEVGYDTPLYTKVLNKHPKWIIGKGLQES